MGFKAVQLIYSLLYLAILGCFSFFLGRLLPKRLFKADRFPYRAFTFEREGRIYRKLRIGRWQGKMPDMSRILPGLMPPKRIVHRPDDAELTRMIQETCVAEFVHFWLSILGLGVIFICPGWQGVLLYALYFLLGNLPFALIQRYNRPRLAHLLNGSRRRAEQLRLRREAAGDKRVLILSCNTGEGHNSCAKAIQESFEARGLRCDVADGLKFVSPLFSKLVSGGHIWIYRHAPALFRIGYRFTEKHPWVLKRKSFAYRLLGCGADPLYSFLMENGYGAVVCTHVFPSMMLTEVKRRYGLNIQTGFVATDYAGCPGIEQTDLDAYFVPDQSLVRSFEVGDIASERIVNSGMPVRQAIYRRTEKAFARRRLSIPADCRHLLVMCGSMGCGPIRKLTQLLATEMEPDWFISVACGSNTKLRTALERRFADHERIRIFGYTDEISLLMDSADLYLTKPGGLSISEAAQKNLPMVMINAVAGCEEYNKNFFFKLGLGVTAESVKGLAHLCCTILPDEDCLERMRTAGRSLLRGSAAECICDRILGVVQTDSSEADLNEPLAELSQADCE